MESSPTLLRKGSRDSTMTEKDLRVVKVKLLGTLLRKDQQKKNLLHQKSKDSIVLHSELSKKKLN